MVKERERLRKLSMWVIYDHPKDYPNSYVARRWELDRPTTDIIVCPRLDAIRHEMQIRGLACLARNPNDDSKIVECWV